MTFKASITEAKNRILAMQPLAVGVTESAEANLSHVDGAGYYWLNGYNITRVSKLDTEQYRYEVAWEMRLITVPTNAGVEGEHEEALLFTYAPDTLDFFTARPHLIYQSGQSGVPGLQPESTQIIPANPLVIRGNDQLAATFTLQLAFQIYVERQF